MVFRGPNGSAAGVGAQHSQCFGSWYSQCPGLKVAIELCRYMLKGRVACNCMGLIIITANYEPSFSRSCLFGIFLVR